MSPKASSVLAQQTSSAGHALSNRVDHPVPVPGVWTGLDGTEFGETGDDGCCFVFFLCYDQLLSKFFARRNGFSGAGMPSSEHSCGKWRGETVLSRGGTTCNKVRGSKETPRRDASRL